MKVLVVGDQHGIHQSLQKIRAQRLENIHIQGEDWQAFAVDNLLSLEIDVVICAVLLPFNSSSVEQQQYFTLLEKLFAYAKQHELPFFLLSSAAVFDGARIAYNETDKPSPNSDYGRFYQQLEQHVLGYEKTIILRTSWLFSAADTAFLAQVITHALEDKCIKINSAAKSCPTAANDIARVLFAMLLQVEQGANNWGVFHYVAADTALGFQFVEAILQQASQYRDNINPKQVCFEHQQQPEVAFYFSPVMLKCKRIRGSFGIHQRAWRALMPAVVRQYLAVP